MWACPEPVMRPGELPRFAIAVLIAAWPSQASAQTPDIAPRYYATPRIWAPETAASGRATAVQAPREAASPALSPFTWTPIGPAPLAFPSGPLIVSGRITGIA